MESPDHSSDSYGTFDQREASTPQNISEAHLKSLADIVLKLSSDLKILDLHVDEESRNLSLNEGHNLLDYIRREDILEFEQELETIQQSRVSKTNIRFEAANKGMWRTYELHIQLAHDGWNCTYVITGLDVTEKERQSQYRQVSRRVFRHNLRNDLNVIGGHADLILSAQGEDEMLEHAKVILMKTAELHKLVGKIQAISKRVNLIDTDVESLDIQKVVQRAVQKAQKQYSNVEYRLEGKWDEKHIFGNRLIKTALENALENAAVHNTSSNPVVIVSTGVDKESDSLLIKIDDNGPGIPYHETRAIQTGNENQLEHTSGVGLWIIKWIVEGHSGTVTFTSSETFSTGTLVTISLPMTEVESPV